MSHTGDRCRHEREFAFVAAFRLALIRAYAEDHPDGQVCADLLDLLNRSA